MITTVTTVIDLRKPYKSIFFSVLILFNASFLAITLAALIFVDQKMVMPNALAPYHVLFERVPSAATVMLIWALGDGALLIIGVLLPGTRTLTRTTHGQ